MVRLAFGLVAVLAVCAPSTSAQSSPQDVGIAQVTSAESLSYLDGYLAWQERGPDGSYAVVLRSPAGHVRRIASALVASPQPKLGTDHAYGGRIVTFAGTGLHGDTDLYAYDIGHSRTRRVDVLSTARTAERAPSVLDGAWAFVRPGPRGGVYTRSSGVVRRISRVIATETARNVAGRVAYTTPDGIRVRPVSGARGTVTINAPGAHGIWINRYNAAFIVDGRLWRSRQYRTFGDQRAGIVAARYTPAELAAFTIAGESFMRPFVFAGGGSVFIAAVSPFSL